MCRLLLKLYYYILCTPVYVILSMHIMSSGPTTILRRVYLLVTGLNLIRAGYRVRVHRNTTFPSMAYT